jgi:tetratricopeptide (TPR) repeat protein
MTGFAFLGVTGYLAATEVVTPQETGLPQINVEALRALSPGELSDAYDAAKNSFTRNPLNAESLRQLSRIAEVRGEKETSERLRLIAGDMQPRALGIQAEALAILLERRDFERAMTRLDGLIRARPNRTNDLFAVVAAMAADPGGLIAVTAKVATQPPWREQFLARTVSSGMPQVAQQIMSKLREMGTAPSAAELDMLISHHLKRGEMNEAYAIWLSSLGDEELERVKLVFDGSFDKENRNLHFDWTVEPAGGLSHRRFPRNTASMDMSLQLEFDDFRNDFKHLSQILRLRPGRYRLSGEVRFEDFLSPSGLVFRVHCMSGGDLRQLDETGMLPQSSQWIAFEKSFAVPEANCPDQLLRLEFRAGAGGNGDTRGRVALDNMAIDKLPALAP